MTKSVGIAGAGIIGRLLALKLLNNGWNVTIFDAETKEGEKNCSHTAAGLLSPFAALDSSESIIHIGNAIISLMGQYTKHFK